MQLNKVLVLTAIWVHFGRVLFTVFFFKFELNYKRIFIKTITELQVWGARKCRSILD